MRAVRAARGARRHGFVGTQFQYPILLPALREAWHMHGMTKAADGTLFRTGFFEMNLRLQQALNPKPIIKEAMSVAAWDWANDSQGDLSIDFEAFCSSVIEMLKLYGTTNQAELRSEEFFQQLLRSVLERISYVPEQETELESDYCTPSFDFRAALEDVFDQVDANKDGMLDLDELQAVPGFQMEMLNKLDRNNNGALSRKEFIDALCQESALEPEDIAILAAHGAVGGCPSPGVAMGAAAESCPSPGGIKVRRRFRDLGDIVPLSKAEISCKRFRRRRQSFVDRMHNDSLRRHSKADGFHRTQAAFQAEEDFKQTSLSKTREKDIPETGDNRRKKRLQKRRSSMPVLNTDQIRSETALGLRTLPMDSSAKGTTATEGSHAGVSQTPIAVLQPQMGIPPPQTGFSRPPIGLPKCDKSVRHTVPDPARQRRRSLQLNPVGVRATEQASQAAVASQDSEIDRLLAQVSMDVISAAEQQIGEVNNRKSNGSEASTSKQGSTHASKRPSVQCDTSPETNKQLSVQCDTSNQGSTHASKQPSHQCDTRPSAAPLKHPPVSQQGYLGVFTGACVVKTTPPPLLEQLPSLSWLQPCHTKKAWDDTSKKKVNTVIVSKASKRSKRRSPPPPPPAERPLSSNSTQGQPLLPVDSTPINVEPTMTSLADYLAEVADPLGAQVASYDSAFIAGGELKQREQTMVESNVTTNGHGDTPEVWGQLLSTDKPTRERARSSVAETWLSPSGQHS